MTDAAGTPDDTIEPNRDDEDGRRLALLAARTADDRKASDVVVLDVGAVLTITGFFVIASASNTRLVASVAEEIERVVKEESGRAPVRTEGMREKQWALIDYGDVVVHVFLQETRDFYEIERLYGDVPKLDWTP